MKKIMQLCLLTFAISLFVSCTKVIGYSVVLWQDEAHNLTDGTVVPVYLKSNISHVYVVSLENSKEKFEVPLWKLSAPEKKGKALKRAELHSAYKDKYAWCAVDGLPIRADKVNTSKQIYRLRKNEVVKALYKGEGVAPTSGGKALEGEWLRVLAGDGTLGWCFSHNLRVFDINSGKIGPENDGDIKMDEKDALLEQALATVWYPDYYSSMITSKQIDPVYFRTDYGFNSGVSTGTVSMVLPNLNIHFDYSGVEKIDDRVYRFNNLPIEMTVRNSRSLVINYTDDSGKPKTYNFTSLGKDVDIESLLQEELKRRVVQCKEIVSLGPDFKSGNYGSLSFSENFDFEWNGFTRLVPSIIPKGVKGKGTFESKYFLPVNLRDDWDGIITMNFEDLEREINFLYKRETAGLRMTLVNVSSILNESTGRNKVSVSLPANSIVLFFQK